MNEKILEVMKTAEQFGSIAKKVNESSVKRRDFARKVVALTDEVKIIMEDLYKAILKVTESNEGWCQQDRTILTMCLKIISNLKLQEEQLQQMLDNKSGAADVIGKIRSYNSELMTSVKKVISNLESVLDKDLDIAQMDRLLMFKKKRQINSLNVFRNMTLAVLDDAVNAIAGSASNLKRGQDLAANVRDIETLLTGNKTHDLEKLICDAWKGWNIATEVNKNSSSQYEFAMKVVSFMDDFYEESLSIKDIVVRKHGVFESNLQVVSVYIVFILMDFKKYLGVESLLSQILINDKFVNGMGNFKFLLDEVITLIKDLLVMNIDMTLISHVDNEFESLTIDSTDKEIKIFDNLQIAVKNMSESAAYPVEGSGTNINNGKKIEQLLRQITSLAPECGKSDIMQRGTVMVQNAKTILVIDDSLVIRQVVAKVLETVNYGVVEANDGSKGLACLDGRAIDLILCDVNMPVMNGIEFLQAMKNDVKYASYKFTPIIMLTTEAGESMKEKGKELGARTWLVKPFQPDNLLEKIKLLIG